MSHSEGVKHFHGWLIYQIYTHTDLWCYLCVSINGMELILIKNQFAFYLRKICFNGKDVAVPSPWFGSFWVTASCVYPAGSFLGDPQLTPLNRPFSLICIPTGSAPSAGKAELDCSEHPPHLFYETFTPIIRLKP